MNQNKYGKIKITKNLFLKDAQEMVNNENVGIVITECTVSNKIKSIFNEANIILYENVESNEINQLITKLEEKMKEK